jgi:hypothetical protein
MDASIGLEEDVIPYYLFGSLKSLNAFVGEDSPEGGLPPTLRM